MAETLISPGVLTRENDQSFITQQPVTVGAAIVGPTVKGPVEIPTIVTSYSDYQNRFGTTFDSGSDQYSFLTSISAYNYFQNGGESLLVARVVSGSSTWDYAESAIPAEDGTAFTLEVLDQGELFNNSGSVNQIPNGDGALYSGSKDNIRWEVANSSSDNGTFDLLIRRGDDKDTNKTVLETFSGLSLDPKSDNYVARVIGDYKYEYDTTENYVKVTGDYPNASRYVRVKSVSLKTPDYFDNAGNAKAAFSGYIPTQGSGSYSGTFEDGEGSLINAQGVNNMFGDIATQTQGLVAADYSDMLNLLANQDDYQFNVLTTPGLIRGVSAHSTAITTAINNVQSRGDAIYIIDPSAYGLAISAADGPVAEAGTINSSYGAMYWPWLQTSDPDTGDNVWVPASTMIPGVYAFNDNASEPWFAPAGINRGGLTTVIRPERKLSQANRDSLYQNKVNPIASFPGVGTVVYGQKTLQRQASALDRVNVRRLLIALKSYIGQTAQTLVFEQNTAATRNNFLAQVNPYLESVVQRQGLYAFKVVMDESNNTPDVVDRNQMVGAIYLQPTKTAEFIILDFNVLPTGATFPS